MHKPAFTTLVYPLLGICIFSAFEKFIEKSLIIPGKFKLRALILFFSAFCAKCHFCLKFIIKFNGLIICLFRKTEQAELCVTFSKFLISFCIMRIAVENQFGLLYYLMNIFFTVLKILDSLFCLIHGRIKLQSAGKLSHCLGRHAKFQGQFSKQKRNLRVFMLKVSALANKFPDVFIFPKFSG